MLAALGAFGLYGTVQSLLSGQYLMMALSATGALLAGLVSCGAAKSAKNMDAPGNFSGAPVW